MDSPANGLANWVTAHRLRLPDLTVSRRGSGADLLVSRSPAFAVASSTPWKMRNSRSRAGARSSTVPRRRRATASIPAARSSSAVVTTCAGGARRSPITWPRPPCQPAWPTSKVRVLRCERPPDFRPRSEVDGPLRSWAVGRPQQAPRRVLRCRHDSASVGAG